MVGVCCVVGAVGGGGVCVPAHGWELGVGRE